ncbi:MAG: hypothetical protein SWO11_16500 [Thermodesulfobacteriota bacterium]|nr:hypothetical protein [Thermodesulfobacteriota bacterium]
MRECKKRRFHTTLDTTRHVSWKVIEEEYPFAFAGNISNERLEYIKMIFSEIGVVINI